MSSMEHHMPDFTGFRLDKGRYELESLIGAGGCGVIYRAVDLQTRDSSGAPVQRAVKITQKPGPHKADSASQRREICLHGRVSEHPNVLTLIDAFEDRQFFYLVMDYCHGGDLYQHVTAKDTYVGDDEAVRSVYLQILDAVQACHTRGVFHRDLKPENILCSVDGKKVYLGDFGLATIQPRSDRFGCGTCHYMSPECIGEEVVCSTYSAKRADIWALGVILVNMITQCNPWGVAMSHDPCFREFLEDPYFFECLPVSKHAAKILKAIFKLNPAERISIPSLRKAVLAAPTFFVSESDFHNRRSCLPPDAIIEVPRDVEYEYDEDLIEEVMYIKDEFSDAEEMAEAFLYGCEDEITPDFDWNSSSDAESEGPITPGVLSQDPRLHDSECVRRADTAPRSPGGSTKKTTPESPALNLLERLEMIAIS